MCHVQRKPAPDARVIKIREYEDKLYDRQQGVQVNTSQQLAPPRQLFSSPV